MLFDGHARGNETRLMKGFANPNGKQLVKCKHTIYLASTQQSEEKRRTKLRGTAVISQVEFLHLVTGSELDVPERQRLHFTSSTLGDMIGPFDVPGRESAGVWRVKQNEKPKLYKAGFMACGGTPLGATPAPSAGDVDSKDKQPAGDEKVAFTYHGRSPILYEELQHSYCVDGWIDLTCNDGVLALTALRAKKTYFGVCFSSEHQSALKAFILDEIFQGFQSEGDPLHQPGLAELAQATTTPATRAITSSSSGSGCLPKSAKRGGAAGGTATVEPALKASKTGSASDDPGEAGTVPISKRDLLKRLQELDSIDG